MDLPCVRVQDLGSLNGTYLNGRELERNEAAKAQAVLFQSTPPIAAVNCGDIITIGGSSFCVDIVSCPPDSPEGAEHDPLWKADETAKNDCPIRC